MSTYKVEIIDALQRRGITENQISWVSIITYAQEQAGIKHPLFFSFDDAMNLIGDKDFYDYSIEVTIKTVNGDFFVLMRGNAETDPYFMFIANHKPNKLNVPTAELSNFLFPPKKLQVEVPIIQLENSSIEKNKKVIDDNDDEHLPF